MCTDPQNGGRTCEDQRLGPTAETSLCNEGDCLPVTETLFDDMILNEEQIAWLKRGIVHGEIDDNNVENTNKLENNPLSGLSDNAVRNPNRLWPNNIVYYSFDGTLTSSEEEEVRKKLDNLQQKLFSCLTFREKIQGNRIIVGTRGNECSCCSHVGYIGTTQNLYLHPRGCWSTAHMEHEFLHAIGIYHTHSRVDRDQYVIIKVDNIEKSEMHNFDKYNQATIYNHGLPYDYESVMHYPDNAFPRYASGNLKTIETIDTTKQDTIGKSTGVSNGDVELVRRAYGCVSGP